MALAGESAAAAPAAEEGTVLAFDFGLKRIGVAVGESSLRQAHPLTTIDASDEAARFDAIAKLIALWQPTRLVVGLPRHQDGRSHEMEAHCRRFARRLHGRFGLPLDFADETLSSAAAEEALRAGGFDPRRDKARIDALAAQAILATYFDAAPRR